MPGYLDKTGLGGLGVEQTDIQSVMAANCDLFSQDQQESSLLYGKDLTIQLTCGLTQKGPFNFVVPGEGNEYVYLPLTRLNGKFKVVKEDGTNIASADKVSLCNLSPHTLFSQIEIKFNNTTVTYQTHRNYPYLCFFTEELSYGKGAKESHLALHRYLDDQPGKVSELDTENNSGLKERRKWIAGSKECDFSVPIHAGVMHTERFLPPNVEINIDLTRNEHSFTLICPPPAAGTSLNGYKIIITQLELQVRKIVIHPQVIAAHHSIIQKEPARYPIVGQKVIDTLISENTTTRTVPNIIRGKLPVQMIFGFVSSKSFDGQYTANPFHFQHFNINSFYITVNGVPIPSPPFKPDFANKLYARELRHFYDGLQIYHDNLSNGITWESFCAGRTFFVVDLTPDKCGAFHKHEIQNGTIDVYITFKNALTESIQMLTHVVFKGDEILVHKDGTVQANFY